MYPPSKEPLNLENPQDENPSMGQAQSVLTILENKVQHLISFSFQFIFDKKSRILQIVIICCEISSYLYLIN